MGNPALQNGRALKALLGKLGVTDRIIVLDDGRVILGPEAAADVRSLIDQASATHPIYLKGRD